MSPRYRTTFTETPSERSCEWTKYHIAYDDIFAANTDNLIGIRVLGNLKFRKSVIHILHFFCFCLAPFSYVKAATT